MLTPLAAAAVMIIAAVELPEAGAWPQLVTVLLLKVAIAPAPFKVKALDKPVKVLELMEEPEVLPVISIPLPRYWSVVLVEPVKVLPVTETSTLVKIP